MKQRRHAQPGFHQDSRQRILVHTISSIICLLVPLYSSVVSKFSTSKSVGEACILTKTSEAEAPERKGNRSINREEPFCVAEGFTSGDENNGDSGDLK